MLKKNSMVLHIRIRIYIYIYIMFCILMSINKHNRSDISDVELVF